MLQSITTVSRRPLIRFSDTLSSIHRPLSHRFTATVSNDRLLNLPLSFLHYIFSFIDSFSFSFRVPAFSRSYHWLWTDSSLHIQYGRERLGLSELQWELFRSESFFGLSLPVYQYEQIEEDVRERRYANFIQRRQSSNCSSSSSSSAQIIKQGESTGKDWAMECIHLYQHIHFATLYLFRRAPNRTLKGNIITYHLPRLLICVLIDQLTSSYVFCLLEGVRSVKPFSNPCLLPIDYTVFSMSSTSRSSTSMSSTSSSDPITVRIPPDDKWGQGGCVIGSEPPIPATRSAEEVEGRRDHNNGGGEMGLAEDAADDDALCAVYDRRLRDEFGSVSRAFVSSWPETALVGMVSSRMGGGESCMAIWYGEALRCALHKTSEGELLVDERSLVTSASTSLPTVDVLLDSCPIISYASSRVPVLLEMDSECWVRRGCIERSLTADEAAMVDDWISTIRPSVRAVDRDQAVAPALEERLRRLGTNEGQCTQAAWIRYLRRTAAKWMRGE